LPAQVVIPLKLHVAAASITLISSLIISLVVFAVEILIFFQMTDPLRGIRGIYISNLRKFTDITKANINGRRHFFVGVAGAVPNRQ